jgi:hypothetical protein
VIENKFERVEEDSPERCQGIFKGGQCPYKRIEGTQYCSMHTSHAQKRSQELESIRLYRLGQWQGRADELNDHNKVKSLREEAGILRVTLEAIVVKCQSQSDLMMYSSKIADLVMKIEKVVVSIHKLESSLGMMIDKLAAQQLANEIVSIISEHITDSEAVMAIADRIGLAIENTGKKLEV